MLESTAVNLMETIVLPKKSCDFYAVKGDNKITLTPTTWEKATRLRLLR
jgi:hypothetical protein